MNEISWDSEDIGCIINMIRNEKHQIVPVIGADVFYVQQGKNEILLYDYIFQKIIETFIEREFQAKVMKDCSGSHLRRMKKLQNRLSKYGIIQKFSTSPNIYSCINSLLTNPNIRSQIRIRDSVKEFLQNGNFPLIITTCYINLLEELLTAPHGKRYQSVGYYCQSNQDIKDDLDEQPTIFHLFGISESGTVPMITEDDFLKYLHFLHNQQAPHNLKNYLQMRTVLALGCNVPDWAFRFILLSLMEKDGQIEGRTNLLGGAFIRDIEQNLEFKEFLEEISYLHGDDIDKILKPINDKIDRKIIFLSYSAKEDTNEWDGIQTILKKLEKNYKVWFFNEQTKNKYGERYWDLIQDGLRECDIFLAVMTNSMITKMKEISPNGPIKDYDAGFLWEWKMMMDEQQKRPNNKKALCLGYFLDPVFKDVQTIINDPKLPLRFLKPIFDNEQNIINVSPSKFDPDQFISL